MAIRVRRSSVSFDLQCRAVGLMPPVGEYRFHPVRRWRFDWAWPARKIALEVEGGVFIQGRHSRGVGMEKDMEKYNAAAIMGYTVLRVTPRMITDGTAIAIVEQAFSAVGSRLDTSETRGRERTSLGEKSGQRSAAGAGLALDDVVRPEAGRRGVAPKTRATRETRHE